MPGGHIKAFCDPETTTSMPQSVGLERNGAETRNGVDDDERSGLLRHGCQRLDVADDTGRGLRVGQIDDADISRIGQRRA